MVIRSVSVVAIIFTTTPKPVRVVLVVVFVAPLLIRCALEFAAAARTAQEEDDDDDDDDVILDADDAPNWLKLLSIDIKYFPKQHHQNQHQKSKREKLLFSY
jgi:hypothetical protein